MRPSKATSPGRLITGLFWIVLLGTRPLSGEELTPETMKAGLEFIVSKIEAVHPMAHPQLPADVRKAADAARAKIRTPLTSQSYYFIVSELVASLKDAHSEVALQPDRAAELSTLPLPFLWLEEGIVISEDRGPLRRGEVVTSIGGSSPEQILRNLSPVISSENEYHLKAVAPQKLIREDYLDYLGLINSGRQVPIQLDREGKDRKIHLALDHLPQEADNKPLFQYEVDPSRSLGLFRMDRCVNSEDYRTKLHQFMIEITEHRIERIVVDLRQNTGGNIVAAFAFLNYLDLEYRSFSVHQRMSEAFAEQYADFVHPGLLELLRSHGADFSTSVYQLPGRAIHALMRQLLKNSEPIEERLKFPRTLYVLTSPTTFSSANLFASLIQDNRLGQIVGEPTGNAVNFHGQPVRFEIPGTEFQLTLATSKNIRPDRRRNNQKAVFPDIPVPTTAADIRTGRDPQLAYLKLTPEHPSEK